MTQKDPSEVRDATTLARVQRLAQRYMDDAQAAGLPASEAMEGALMVIAGLLQATVQEKGHAEGAARFVHQDGTSTTVKCEVVSTPAGKPQ